MSRIDNILEDFTRYCGGPYSKTTVDILDELNRLNDDLWNMRDKQLLLERINTSQNLLSKLREEVDADEVVREP